MIVNTWLPDFLRAVKEQFPRVSIELTVDLSVNLKPELFSRSIDMAFQNGPFVRQTTGGSLLTKHGCTRDFTFKRRDGVLETVRFKVAFGDASCVLLVPEIDDAIIDNYVHLHQVWHRLDVLPPQ